MDYNYYVLHKKLTPEEEALPKELCSQSPILAYLHEVIFLYLQELSYYLVQLKGLGITNMQIKDNIINVFSGIIINVEYEEKMFSEIITQLYTNLQQAKDLYSSVCKRNNLKAKFFKSVIKNPQKLSYTDAIVYGQKIFNQKFNQFSVEQMHMFGLILNILKSICIHMVELKELGIDEEKAYATLLLFLNLENSYDMLSKKIPELLNEFTKLDHNLLMDLNTIREERYGQIISKEIACSTRPNKAILVSGTNLRELELLLEATKDKNIDVYTHGHMIMAHAFPKFKKYPHLVGHFGDKPETYLMDFAEFPGAIFMTKHAFQKTDTLFRSRIYSADSIAPKGANKIINNNFEPLIQSALSAPGFNEVKEKPAIVISIDEKQILKKITDVVTKIETGKIKHVFIIGVSNNTKKQREYFETFLNLLGEDCFVLSFSYTNNKNNILLIQSDYGFPLIYKAIEILSNRISIEKLNPNILLTRCEPHTISNIIYMKNIGIKKIYFTECSPSMVNPILNNTMREVFKVKNYTSPETDLKDMLMN